MYTLEIERQVQWDHVEFAALETFERICLVLRMMYYRPDLSHEILYCVPRYYYTLFKANKLLSWLKVLILVQQKQLRSTPKQSKQVSRREQFFLNDVVSKILNGWLFNQKLKFFVDITS